MDDRLRQIIKTGKESKREWDRARKAILARAHRGRGRIPALRQPVPVQGETGNERPTSGQADVYRGG